MSHNRLFQPLIHPKAIEICNILQNPGFQAYIVGGCVRDLHLGLQPKDWDITTNASPEQVIQLFERTIPTGLQHGTVTVCMGEGVENHFEVTTFRVEGEYRDGRRPASVQFVTNITEDLARRDFTINAIAFDPVSNVGVDPFHGYEDIKIGLIRAVGVPQKRFQEDGLRIMRAARFAARFGFAIHDETFQGMIDSLETLKKVSKERINDELSKTLMTSRPHAGVMYLHMSGALDIVCPCLMGRQLPLIPSLNQCAGELETRLALLYNKLPHLLVEQELIDLKFSNKSIKRVAFLLQRLLDFQHLEDGAFPYRKFIAKFKNEAPDPWEHTYNEFIKLTRAMDVPAETLLAKYQDTTVHSRKAMQINGDDLLKAGMTPGPRMKALLDVCYQEILEHPEHNDKEYLLEMLRQAVLR